MSTRSRRRHRLRIPWKLVLPGIVVAAVIGGVVISLREPLGRIGVDSPLWLRRTAPEIRGGAPRLVVDRREVDLGYLRFGTPAAATFTLRNAGDGTLKIHGAPPVSVVRGC